MVGVLATKAKVQGFKPAKIYGFLRADKNPQ
jgi:hypothetical protein